jgi:hypothetical protein
MFSSSQLVIQSSHPMSSCNKKIIASSDGVNAHGSPIITPASVLSYLDSSNPQQDPQVYRSLATDNINFLVNPIWTRSVLNVMLPVQKIFDHVPMNPVLIRHWLKQSNGIQGGLLFPRPPLEYESRTPSIQILKHRVDAAASETGYFLHSKASGILLSRAPPTASAAPSIRVDLNLFVFRRELLPCPDLQRFDPAVWHPNSYELWVHLHTMYAPILDEESNGRIPPGSTTVFRRIMHTHFEDCGLLFGDMWWKFGLSDILSDSDPYTFMRNTLTDMFLIYTAVPSAPLLTPFSNAVTMGSGQRICANCLATKMGSAQMMRCKCHQVYYCSTACQKANWKLHREVCGFAKK